MALRLFKYIILIIGMDRTVIMKENGTLILVASADKLQQITF